MSNSLQPYGLYSPWNSPGQNTGVGSLSLFQGIFPAQGLNQVSWIAGGFFTSWATREALKNKRYSLKVIFKCVFYPLELYPTKWPLTSIKMIWNLSTSFITKEFSQFLDPDKDSSQPYGNLVLNPEFAESLSLSIIKSARHLKVKSSAQPVSFISLSWASFPFFHARLTPVVGFPMPNDHRMVEIEFFGSFSGKRISFEMVSVVVNF